MCVFSWSWYTCGFSTRCHVAGCPSGVPLLAVPLRVAGRTGSAPLPLLNLVVVSASGVLGGGAPSSGPSGFRRWEPSPFQTLSGGCLSLHWQAWRDRGAEPWVVGVLLVGYCLPFLSTPPLSNVPISMPSSSPTSIKGAALEEVTLGLIALGAVELAPLPSPGFYSRLFVVWKSSGSWRPVIDLFHLNRFVDVSPFRMETIQSVLLSVRQGDWMASIAFKEAYLQLQVHPASRHFLRFMFRDTVYQFKALCFGLSTAPQVFTRVMAPVSAILLSMGIRMRRYLNNWLVQSSSRGSLLGDLQTVLQLCHELGIVVNPRNPTWFHHGWFSVWGLSSTPPLSGLLRRRSASLGCSQQPQVSVLRLAYCELMAIATRRPFFAGSPSSWRQTEDAVPPALPPSILGSSGSGGSSVCIDGVSSRPPVVASSPSSISRSVSLPGVSSPTLLVRRLRRGVGGPSRSSDRFGPVGRPTGGVIHKCQGTASCQTGSSPVPVISTGSHGGCLLRQHHSGGLPSQGGWHPVSSPQHLGSGDLALDESLSIRLAPQFLPGSNNVLADALSRPHQLPHSEWSLNLTVFQSLRRLWPVQIDLFATSDIHRWSISFSPFRDPMSAGTDAFLQSWDGLQAYAFPPVAIIPRVLTKLRASPGTGLTLVAPHWAQRPWFSNLLQLSLAPPVILPARQDLLRLPRSRLLYPDLRRLRLHAWRLSSDLPKPLPSPPQ